MPQSVQVLADAIRILQKLSSENILGTPISPWRNRMRRTPAAAFTRVRAADRYRTYFAGNATS
jgi:hypothetical protein